MTMPPIVDSACRIREAGLVDVPDIAALHAATWASSYRHLLDPDQIPAPDVAARSALWHSVIAAAACPVMIAETGGGLAGFVHATSCRDRDRDVSRVGEITALYVDSDHQRRGVGAALLARSLQQLETRGFSVVSLWVVAFNYSARRFYEAQGFEIDGGVREQPRTGRGEVRYVRLLTHRPAAEAQR